MSLPGAGLTARFFRWVGHNFGHREQCFNASGLNLRCPYDIIKFLQNGRNLGTNVDFPAPQSSLTRAEKGKPAFGKYWIFSPLFIGEGPSTHADAGDARREDAFQSPSSSGKSLQLYITGEHRPPSVFSASPLLPG